MIHCCHENCDKPATVEIRGESGLIEDMTNACTEHVGAMLGTPVGSLIGAPGGIPENTSWTVTWIAEAPE